MKVSGMRGPTITTSIRLAWKENSRTKKTKEMNTTQSIVWLYAFDDDARLCVCFEILSDESICVANNINNNVVVHELAIVSDSFFCRKISLTFLCLLSVSVLSRVRYAMCYSAEIKKEAEKNTEELMAWTSWPHLSSMCVLRLLHFQNIQTTQKICWNSQ